MTEKKLTDEEKKKFCDDKRTELQNDNPRILFLIARSKNLNLVIYEALVEEKDSKTLRVKKPVDVYWLDVDPAYVAANRKKGVKSDRSELNFLESYQAYGVGFEAVKDKTGQYDLKLVAVPDRPIRLSIDEKGIPHTSINLTSSESKEKEACSLDKVYVSTTEGWLSIPKVEYVELFGTSLKTGKPVIEKVFVK